MQITLQAENILVADKEVDFRKSIDGLCALIVEEMKEQPQQGVYVFYNRARNRVKIIGWHVNGFVLLYKRLEKGKFIIAAEDGRIKLDAKQLSWLLAGLDWRILSGLKTSAFQAYF
jgi:transposase